WIATDRSRARRCVEACVYGTLDFVGYPRFPAPVEFIAAVIAYYVHPVKVSGIVMRLRMFLLLITFLKASHSFRNRLLVIRKNAYLFATMIMTSVSTPFSCCSGIVRLNLM